MFAVALLVFVAAAPRCLAIEVIEGHYKGEKYEPNDQHLKYSSAVVAEESRGSSQGRALLTEEGKPMLPFGNLINQLSSAIHRQLIGAPEPQGRNLRLEETDEKAKQDDDLYYHFYPHNQHLFNLPECATQQVCNAVYKRLNFTQPLCACPPLSDPCSASYLSNDQHTIELRMGGAGSTAVTMIKTCEPVWSVRSCRSPRDWSILALQNTRTGKAHYLVICKCPEEAKLDDDALPAFPEDKAALLLQNKELVDDLLQNG